MDLSWTTAQASIIWKQNERENRGKTSLLSRGVHMHGNWSNPWTNTSSHAFNFLIPGHTSLKDRTLCKNTLLPPLPNTKHHVALLFHFQRLTLIAFIVKTQRRELTSVNQDSGWVPMGWQGMRARGHSQSPQRGTIKPHCPWYRWLRINQTISMLMGDCRWRVNSKSAYGNKGESRSTLADGRTHGGLFRPRDRVAPKYLKADW